MTIIMIHMILHNYSKNQTLIKINSISNKAHSLIKNHSLNIISIKTTKIIKLKMT
jgi:hypothetical protein